MAPRSYPWCKQSIAPLWPGELETFQITHPFHPLHGRTYPLVTYRHAWGEDRVYFHDEDGKLCQVPAGWTNVLGEDPFVLVASGRSAFRVMDLLELCRLVDGISSRSLPVEREEGAKKCVK